MALIKETENQFGNGASNYWCKLKVVFDEQLGMKVYLAHYFSEEAKKENSGQYIKLIELDYSVDEIRNINPDLLNGDLVNNLFDLPFHVGYILIKKDIASATEKLNNNIPEEEWTEREIKLKDLINYKDYI